MAVAVAAVAGAGCALAPTTRGVSRGMEDTAPHSAGEVPVMGFQVTLEIPGRVDPTGELIAVDETSIWLFRDGGYIRVQRQDVSRAVVRVLDSPASAVLAGLTALGTISTLSHGMLLVLSAPVWLVSGISASASTHANDDAAFEPQHFDLLAEFARYPQGPPPFLLRLLGTPEEAPPPPALELPPPPPPYDPGL